MSIFLFFVSVTSIIFVLGYLLLEHLRLSYIVVIIFVAIITAGLIIAKLSVEALKEHFESLEHFSKEILHELNLPISTILTNSQMLQKQLDDPKSKRRFERIDSACAMLQERYSELDYLIQKQMQREVIESFDLKSLVMERYQLLAPLYPQAKFTLSLQSLELKLDKIGLAKVIDNIIDNSIKYSSSTPHVTLKIEGKQLCISDEGVGMDELELLKLFDRYYQADSSNQGFGIGLGLVKAYCDRYKITLNVDSKKGHGTTMKLQF